MHWYLFEGGNFSFSFFTLFCINYVLQVVAFTMPYIYLRFSVLGFSYFLNYFYFSVPFLHILVYECFFIIVIFKIFGMLF